MQQITQPHKSNYFNTAFGGKWEGVAFNAMRALALTFKPTQNLRTRTNAKGTLEVRGEYAPPIYGFNFFVFEYTF